MSHTRMASGWWAQQLRTATIYTKGFGGRASVCGGGGSIHPSGWTFPCPKKSSIDEAPQNPTEPDPRARR